MPGPNNAIFSESRGQKDIKYHILSSQPVNFSRPDQTQILRSKTVQKNSDGVIFSLSMRNMRIPCRYYAHGHAHKFSSACSSLIQKVWFWGPKGPGGPKSPRTALDGPDMLRQAANYCVVQLSVLIISINTKPCLQRSSEMKSFVLLLLLPLLAFVRGNKDIEQCNKVRIEFNDCTNK